MYDGIYMAFQLTERNKNLAPGVACSCVLEDLRLNPMKSLLGGVCL